MVSKYPVTRVSRGFFDFLNNFKDKVNAKSSVEASDILLKGPLRNSAVIIDVRKKRRPRGW